LLFKTPNHSTAIQLKLIHKQNETK
jgi:hypothetical protein